MPEVPQRRHGILGPRTFGAHLVIGKLLGGWSIMELEVEKARLGDVQITALTAEELRNRLLELADQLIASEAEGRFDGPLRPLVGRGSDPRNWSSRPS